MSDNPWPELSRNTPYVLDGDREKVDIFNISAAPMERIQTELFPEPFVGNINAPVVLLALNPGFSDDDKAYYLKSEAVCRANLRHELEDCPFYPLNKQFKKHSGPQWWRAKLRWFIDRAGEESVANNLYCVECFPYHSKRFGAEKLSVPSQQYSFYLVNQAIERGDLVVIMRGANAWLNAVPALKAYENRCKLQNVQRSWLSPGNFADGWFDKIIERLKVV